MPHIPRERPRPEGKVGYVYLIEMRGDYKIGRTKSWRGSRKKAFSGYPYRVTLVALLRSFNAAELESALHARYAKKRLRGEWFALSPADVQEIQRHPQRVEQEI
jgi:hypothetical protein